MFNAFTCACAAFLALASCTAPGPWTARPEPPFRVLLLGDSISIGYTPFVQEALDGTAVVIRPRKGDEPRKGAPENCAGTTRGMKHIERWLAIDGGDWDVIHFNFGLHDLKRVQPDTGENSNDPSDPRQASLFTYQEQLSQLVARLEETGAQLVFATTTPVPEGDLRPYREPEDAMTYNGVAALVLHNSGIAINDLFQFVTEYPEPIQRPEDVHFTEAGSRALGRRVAEAILEAHRSHEP